MCKPARTQLLLSAAVLLAVAAGAQIPMPRSAEFQVNSTTGTASAPAVAMSPDTGFVVIWQSTTSPGDDASGTSVLGQFFTSTGSKTGDEFQINVATTGDQGEADIGVGADGSFVVVWRSFVENVFEDDRTTIHGRFLSDGAPTGAEFQVNTHTTGPQTSPRVAVQADGSFVVVWESTSSAGTDNSGTSIQSRFYASNGSPVGGEVQVNTSFTGEQRHGAPTVGAPDGTVYVAWTDETGGTLGQRFSSAAVPVGSEFVVSTLLGLSVDDTFRIASDLDSTGFTQLISGPQGPLHSLVLNKIGLDGSVLIDESPVTVPVAINPAATFLEDNEFVVVWEPWYYGAGTSIEGRAYDDAGTPLDEVFTVNAGTSETPAVAATSEADRFVVVWVEDPDVKGRLYSLYSVFEDGFESGDLSAWSAAVGAP